MIKIVLCNKSKKASVRFFICRPMSSMCVQLFTAFDEVILKLYICSLVSASKIKDGYNFHGNEARETILFFSPYFFILIIINVQ